MQRHETVRTVRRFLALDVFVRSVENQCRWNACFLRQTPPIKAAMRFGGWQLRDRPAALRHSAVPDTARDDSVTVVTVIEHAAMLMSPVPIVNRLLLEQ